MDFSIIYRSMKMLRIIIVLKCDFNYGHGFSSSRR